MTIRFDDALRILRWGPSSADYLAACNVIADNLDRLPYRVFIHLPGGLSGNNDPAWSKVKAASEECCACGNERVFEPRDIRHEFKPSTADPIVMSLGDKLYIRPLGAPASAAYTMFEVIDSGGLALSYLPDPMSTSINFSDLFSMQGFRLADLVEPLKQQEHAVFVRDLKHIKQIPLVGISDVNLEAGTVTLVLDEAIEAFDPEEETHTH